jgi:hypothetical protein
MRLLEALLLWLDRSTAHYWLFAATAGGLVLASALVAWVAPARSARWNGSLVYAALIALALFAVRWPLVFENSQGPNPDESQMIAGAIVLKTSPVFWKSVDGTTHGPLNQWPLAALGAAGVRLDYTNTRLFAVGLMWGVVVCGWLALRALFGDPLARVLVLPLATLEITTTFWDFTQYSSEHVSMLLIAVAYWLIAAKIISGPEPAPSRWPALVGIVLGAVPFAKLQAAPIALWLGAMSLIFILRDLRQRPPARARQVAWLIGGAVAVPAAISLMIAVNGIWRDFMAAYITANFAYKDYNGEHGASFLNAPGLYWDLARKAPGFPEFAAPLLALLVPALARGAWRMRDPRLRFAGLALGGLLVAIYVVLAPQREFMHYLQLTITPLALATGVAVGIVLGETATRERWRRLPWLNASLVLAVLFLILTMGWQLRAFVHDPGVPLGAFTKTRGRLSQSAAAETLQRISRPDDLVAVWGWMPQILVEANRAHATREAHTALMIYGFASRDFYRDRYLSDLRQIPPPFFLDMVGPGNFAFENRHENGHESLPLLREFIIAHYSLVADVSGTRLYARTDRAAETAGLLHGRTEPAR